MFSKNGEKIMAAGATGPSRENQEARPEARDEYNFESHAPVTSFHQQTSLPQTSTASHSSHGRCGT